jgi:PLP dependent protein
MPSDLNIYKNLESVRSRIAAACAKAGRRPQDIRLIAVSKGQSVDKIRQFLEICDHQDTIWLGENYVQDLVAKVELIRDPRVKWSYIGRLQSNKLKALLRVADEIQCLASFKHAEFIARTLNSDSALTFKVPYPCFISTNIGNEPQKDGLAIAEVRDFVHRLKEKPLTESIYLQGLMSIPPKDLPGEKQIVVYELLKKASLAVGRGQLSMGMSQDLEPAILAGSDVVRVGTDIFGPRGAKSSE